MTKWWRTWRIYRLERRLAGLMARRHVFKGNGKVGLLTEARIAEVEYDLKWLRSKS